MKTVKSVLTNLSAIRKMSISNPIESTIREKLKTLNPTHIEIINESYMHNVPKNSETHFKVVIVSENFKGLSPVQRHRKINDLLAFELKNGVHALSISAKTPDQWDPQEVTKSSPKCLGGFGK